MEKFKGKLKGKIVLTQPPRETHPSFEPAAKRYSDADLKTLAETPIPMKPDIEGGRGPRS